MSTLTLPKLRVGRDILMHVTLTDDQTQVSWNSLSDIAAFLYSDEQQVMAGRASSVEVNTDDEYDLLVRYTSSEPQYLGINRLVVTGTYSGQTVTYDVPVLQFVATTAEEGDVTIADGTAETNVNISVSNVSSSLLDEAVAACVAATADAEAATAEAENINVSLSGTTLSVTDR